MRPTRQKEIIDAARMEFAEKGYGAASIRDIALRCGMSMSALYHYYPGKQDLLKAILDEGVASYFGADHPVKSGVLTEERSLEPANLAAYREQEARGTQQFQEIIAAGRTAGVFTTPYPDDARRAIIAMCNAIAQWWRPDGPLTREDLVERYVALALTIVEYRPRSVSRAYLRGKPESSVLFERSIT